MARIHAALVCALALASSVAARQLAQVAPVVNDLRSLQPFTGLDVGYSGCMPLSVLVVEGDDYSAEVTGPQACTLISI